MSYYYEIVFDELNLIADSNHPLISISKFVYLSLNFVQIQKYFITLFQSHHLYVWFCLIIVLIDFYEQFLYLGCSYFGHHHYYSFAIIIIIISTIQLFYFIYKIQSLLE